MPVQTRSMSKKNNEIKIYDASFYCKPYEKNKQMGKLTLRSHLYGKGAYKGELFDKKPNGYGKCIWNGEKTMGGTYEGEWNAGEMCGRGKFTYKDGDTYDGEIKDGMKWGYGKYTHAYSNIYDGIWYKQKFMKGKVTFWNRDFYEGEWENYNREYGHRGNSVGIGKMIYSNGDIYEGEWREGKKHGNGKMTYKNGEIYDGRWSQDVISGYGKMTFRNGDSYQGWWSNGKIDNTTTVETLKKYM